MSERPDTDTPAAAALRIKQRRLTAEMKDFIEQTKARIAVRVAEIMKTEADPNRRRALIDAEAHQAIRELDELNAKLVERLRAVEH